MIRIRWHAVKTAEDLLTWYEHEIYPMMMEIDQSLNHMCMDGNKCGNLLWYSHWRTPPHADPHTERVYL